MQVVAGTNYKLKIRVKDAATGKIRKFEVVVFRSLPPDVKLKLTSVDRVPRVQATAGGSPPPQITGMMMGSIRTNMGSTGRKLRL